MEDSNSIEDLLTIRNAELADVSNLAALSIQVWLDTYADSGIRPALSDYVLDTFTREHFRDAITDPIQRIRVAYVDGHLVGYARLLLNRACPDDVRPTTELSTLYVQEPFTHRGIGSALLHDALAVATALSGKASLWLDVYHGNHRAIAFYRKHGLVQRGSTYFEFAGERHENFVFVVEAEVTQEY